MTDENRAKDCESRQTSQKPRPSLKPSLIPEHDSILLHRLEEYLPQSNRGDFNRNHVQIMRALNHGLDVPAGKDAHFVAVRSDPLNTRNTKLLPGCLRRKDQIDPPIELAQFVQGSIHQ